MNFIPYKSNETLEHKYYQIPQELFVNEKYKNKLNSDSKILYAFLLDRLSLSQKNHWIDEDNNVYLIFTREEVQEKLNLSDKTVTKSFKILMEVNLVQEKRQGLGKPNLIYVGKINHSDSENLRFLNRKNYDSGIGESTALDSENLRGINTNNINTNISILSNQQQEEVDETRKSYDMFFEAFPKQRKNAFTQQDILADINEFGNELYQYALKLAMTNEANYPSYIERIFNSWRNEGITTLEQAKEKQSKHSNSKPDKDFIGFGIQGSGY